MKAVLFLTALTFTSLLASANTLTAVASGDWTASSTWNTNTLPANGDVAIIPAGKAVQVNSTVNLATANIMVLDYGALVISGGNSSLNLGSASEVVVFPGGDIANGNGNGSHTINIGAIQVYKGTQGSVYGPQYATIATSGFTGFNPLPLKFVAFSLAAAAEGVTVKWTTAQEVAVDHFEIERSLDGKQWTAAGRTSATGSETTETNYTFNDKAVTAATVFYRIKEVDKNAVFTYTAIKSIASTTPAMATVKVAPAGQGRILIEISQPLTETIMVRMISLSGQVVKQQALNNTSGQVIVNTALKGDYIIQVTNGSNINTASQMIL